MLLKRIVLERFRRLDQQEFTFQPGLNVVKGPNEAGKTTLQEAILFALLGNPSHSTLERTRRVVERVSWGRDRDFSITLDLEDGEGTPYRLEKDWQAHTVCLTDLQTGDREEDAESVSKRIGQMLGHGSLKLLKSTVCVEQDDIDDISTGRREIGDLLQRIVTGRGDQETTVSAVLSDLAATIAQMERGWRTHAPRNPGPIRVKQDEIEDLEEQLSDVRREVDRVGQAREQLVAVEAQVADTRSRLGTFRSLKELCDRRGELEDRRVRWQTEEHRLEASIERIKNAEAQVAKADEALGAYAQFDAASPEAVRQLEASNQRAGLLQEGIEQRSAELEELREQLAEEPGTGGRLPVAPLIGAGAGLLLLLIDVVLALTSSRTVGSLVGLLGLLACIGCLIWLAVALSRPRPVDLGSRVAALDRELEELRHEHQAVLKQSAEGLAPFGCTSWDEFASRRSEHGELVSQRRNARTRLDALLGDRTLETLTQERKIASHHRRDEQEALETGEMRTAAEVTPLRYQQLTRAIERLEAELEEQERAQIKYETRCKDARYAVEDVHRLTEQQAVAQRSLAHLERRLEVTRLTLSVMDQAKEQTMRSARDELEPRIGAYLSRITSERYKEAKADDDLNLQVFSREKGDWVKRDSGDLSRGTVDQLYWATRLALLDLLFPDARPPLLLDDPFVKFDPQRRQQAVALCREIAQHHQVLLFTCHDHYDEAADWIVTLPDPSAG